MRWGVVGGGDLRENREDPAPTVGVAGISMRDAARHVATNARPPYAYARPSATVCAYHTPRIPPTYGRPYDFYHDAAWEGRALGVGRATLGPPLQHLPYQERNGQSRKLIEM